MQKYYVQINDEQEGPFSLEELKEKKITKETLIWFDGIDDWKKASEIEDIKEIIKGTPPPITKKAVTTPPPVIKIKSLEGSAKDSFLKTKKGRNIVVMSLVAIVLFIGLFVYFENENKQRELEFKLEEQNLRIQEQQNIENQRKLEEQRKEAEASDKQRKKNYNKLKKNYDDAVNSLRNSKIRLNEIQQFKVLRSAYTREQEIKAQLENLRDWENEVERLEKELKKYN